LGGVLERYVLFIHITGGCLAIVSGYAALFAPKGGRLHRRAGMLFVYAMIVMGIGATIVGIARNNISWLGGPLVIYFVVTSLRTVRRAQTSSRTVDISLMLLGLTLGIVSVVLGVLGIIHPVGPLGNKPAIAGLSNALALLLGAAGDFRVIRIGALTGIRRLRRHLWRMSFAMWVATGSFFLGQAKVIPKPVRVLPLLLVLAFMPLLAMFYWLWRVRRRPPTSKARLDLPSLSQNLQHEF
jgi:hypothetical protein